MGGCHGWVESTIIYGNLDIGCSQHCHPGGTADAEEFTSSDAWGKKKNLKHPKIAHVPVFLAQQGWPINAYTMCFFFAIASYKRSQECVLSDFCWFPESLSSESRFKKIGTSDTRTFVGPLLPR